MYESTSFLGNVLFVIHLHQLCLYDNLKSQSVLVESLEPDTDPYYQGRFTDVIYTSIDCLVEIVSELQREMLQCPWLASMSWWDYMNESKVAETAATDKESELQQPALTQMRDVSLLCSPRGSISLWKLQ